MLRGIDGGLKGLRGPSRCPPGLLPATSVDCSNAQASVDQMNATFAQLGSPVEFSANVQSITQNLANAMPTIAVIGFCGTVQSIGCQAEALTAQMLTAYGQTPGNPTPGAGGFDLSSLLGGPGLVGVLVLAYFLLKK